MIYIGLPQWSHPKWVRLGITSLEEYARHFNCVEGNTTLYALPKPEVVLRWREQTTDDFRFCFKFPATISHQAALRHCDDLVTEFLTRMSPLAPRIGQYWLQLPATFGPRELPALWHFLDSLPLANLIMVWKSAIHSFSPKGKRNKRLIAVYISAALIG